MDLQLLQQTALDAANAAGELIRRGLSTDRAQLGVEEKGDANLVTSFDRAAEAAIGEVLRSRTPDIPLLAEEGGRSGGIEGRYLWVVDPLDGTTNFAHGDPHCAVSIACLEDGRPLVGAILDAARGELFHAVRGHGAWLDGQKLSVSRQSDLDKALLSTGFAYDRRRNPQRYLPIMQLFLRRGQAVRVMGAAALDLAWVACGRFDAFWEEGLNPWDVAAGTLIVEEAGGRVSGYGGAPLDVLAPRQLLATNGGVHQQLVDVFVENSQLWRD